MIETSETIGKLAEACAAAQVDLENLDKIQEGHHYKYADLGQALAELRPKLAAQGIWLSQWPGEVQDEKQFMTTMLAHKSGEWVRCVSSMPVRKMTGMTAPQACGAVQTYMRRYNATAAAGITAEEDNDADIQRTPKKPNPKPAVEQGEEFDLEVEIGAMAAATNLDTLASVWRESRTRCPELLLPKLDDAKELLKSNFNR